MVGIFVRLCDCASRNVLCRDKPVHEEFVVFSLQVSATACISVCPGAWFTTASLRMRTETLRSGCRNGQTGSYTQ